MQYAHVQPGTTNSEKIPITFGCVDIINGKILLSYFCNLVIKGLELYTATLSCRVESLSVSFIFLYTVQAVYLHVE